MDVKILSVSDVTKYIKALIEKNENLSLIWVRGEISNFKHHTSGHMYFTLKDKHSVIRCVMFKSQNIKLKFKPEEGMEILALGSVRIFAKAGTYQLYVDNIEPAGYGSLHIAFEQLKEKLLAEGLFGDEHKKEIPFLPQNIAVITSRSGAALQDIITVANRRFPGINITVIPALVQGENAAADLVEALKKACSLPDIDVIIIGRGGGSFEELWPFNDEQLARTAFSCPCPVVSAVGHETDYTIIDFVADLRAPTPSAAAEIVVPDLREIKKILSTLTERRVKALQRLILQKKLQLDRLENTRIIKKPLHIVEERKMLLDNINKEIIKEFSNSLRVKRSSLQLIIAKLEALSPLSILNRGYSLTTDYKGNLIKDSKVCFPGMGIKVTLGSGILDCLVQEVHHGGD